MLKHLGIYEYGNHVLLLCHVSLPILPFVCELVVVAAHLVFLNTFFYWQLDIYKSYGVIYKKPPGGCRTMSLLREMIARLRNVDLFPNDGFVYISLELLLIGMIQK